MTRASTGQTKKVKRKLRKVVVNKATRKKIHKWLLLFWIVLLPPSLLIWKNSVTWVVFMSHFTILVEHAIGYAEED